MRNREFNCRWPKWLFIACWNGVLNSYHSVNVFGVHEQLPVIEITVLEL